MAETAYPEARADGERARTVFQLRAFAEHVENGSWVDATIDQSNGKDLRSMLVPLGPVAVFGASNFPQAFSTAGGDTASALAARCPVVVKAHPAHPGTCEYYAAAMSAAAERSGMPAGSFNMIHSTSPAIGQYLVSHPSIEAVGFTGSLAAGRCLMDVAAARPKPIPVYAEMGSVNPLFVLPSAVSSSDAAAALAANLAGSALMGVGQFCTQPGIVFAAGDGAAELAEHTARCVSEAAQGTLLTPGIRGAFASGAAQMHSVDGVACLTEGPAGQSGGGCQAQGLVFTTSLANFVANYEVLREEVFGPSTLIVTCDSPWDFDEAAALLGGQLTASVHASAEELSVHSGLIHQLQGQVGRLIFNDFPTGVEVCGAMVHGGPFPAASSGMFSSVGTGAIRRFARPVCYQDFPDAALPAELQNATSGIMRVVNGAPSDAPFSP